MPVGGGGRAGSVAADRTPFTRLAACTQSGATTTQTYAGTDNTQRLTCDSATFTDAAVGITGQSVTGTATGSVREPSGALAGMRTGGTTQWQSSGWWGEPSVDCRVPVIALTRRSPSPGNRPA